jgi:hypothetical protein
LERQARNRDLNCVKLSLCPNVRPSPYLLLGAQYIATLNPDFISGMSEEFTSGEYQRLIVDNTVLSLRDDSPSEKLLGIQVDMHYESK